MSMCRSAALGGTLPRPSRAHMPHMSAPCVLASHSPITPDRRSHILRGPQNARACPEDATARAQRHVRRPVRRRLRAAAARRNARGAACEQPANSHAASGRAPASASTTRCGGGRPTPSSAAGYASSRPVRIASAARRDETKHSYMPSPDTGRSARRRRRREAHGHRRDASTRDAAANDDRACGRAVLGRDRGPRRRARGARGSAVLRSASAPTPTLT